MELTLPHHIYACKYYSYDVIGVTPGLPEDVVSRITQVAASYPEFDRQNPPLVFRGFRLPKKDHYAALLLKGQSGRDSMGREGLYVAHTYIFGPQEMKMIGYNLAWALMRLSIGIHYLQSYSGKTLDLPPYLLHIKPDAADAMDILRLLLRVISEDVFACFVGKLAAIVDDRTQSTLEFSRLTPKLEGLSRELLRLKTPNSYQWNLWQMAGLLAALPAVFRRNISFSINDICSVDDSFLVTVPSQPIAMQELKTDTLPRQDLFDYLIYCAHQPKARGSRNGRLAEMIDCAEALVPYPTMSCLNAAYGYLQNVVGTERKGQLVKPKEEAAWLSRLLSCHQRPSDNLLLDCLANLEMQTDFNTVQEMYAKLAHHVFSPHANRLFETKLGCLRFFLSTDILSDNDRIKIITDFQPDVRAEFLLISLKNKFIPGMRALHEQRTPVDSEMAFCMSMAGIMNSRIEDRAIRDQLIHLAHFGLLALSHPSGGGQSGSPSEDFSQASRRDSEHFDEWISCYLKRLSSLAYDRAEIAAYISKKLAAHVQKLYRGQVRERRVLAGAVRNKLFYSIREAAPLIEYQVFLFLEFALTLLGSKKDHAIRDFLRILLDEPDSVSLDVLGKIAKLEECWMSSSQIPLDPLFRARTEWSAVIQGYGRAEEFPYKGSMWKDNKNFYCINLPAYRELVKPLSGKEKKPVWQHQSSVVEDQYLIFWNYLIEKLEKLPTSQALFYYLNYLVNDWSVVQYFSENTYFYMREIIKDYDGVAHSLREAMNIGHTGKSVSSIALFAWYLAFLFRERPWYTSSLSKNIKIIVQNTLGLRSDEVQAIRDWMKCFQVSPKALDRL